MDGALCLSIEGLVAWGGLEDLDPLLGLAGEVDVLLVGTGSQMEPLTASTLTRLQESGLGVEVMSTPSACRTYNVLLGEGRRVALAVMPV